MLPLAAGALLLAGRVGERACCGRLCVFRAAWLIHETTGASRRLSCSHGRTRTPQKRKASFLVCAGMCVEK